MARFNQRSPAAANRKRARQVTTKGSKRKRSAYTNKMDSPLATHAVVHTRRGYQDTVLGAEQVLNKVSGFEFVSVVMGSSSSSGERVHSGGDLILFVEGGSVTSVTTFEGESNTVNLPAGSSLAIPSGTRWSLSSGEHGASLKVCRSLDYEKSVEQLSDPVAGEDFPAESIPVSVTEEGTNQPRKTPRRRSKAEREAIAVAMGGHRRATILKREGSGPPEARVAHQVNPPGGKVLTDPDTGAQVRSLGPQPMGAAFLESLSEGQSTGVPLSADSEKSIKASNVISKAVAKKALVEEGIASGDLVD